MDDLSMVPTVKLESEMGDKLVVSKGKKAACEEPIKLPEEPSPNGNTAFAWSTVKLESSDGEQFVVSRDAAFMSGVVKSFVKDADESAMDEPIKISNVTGPILAKVLEYCKMHAEKPPSSSSSSSSSDVYVYDYETEKWKETLSRWDREYCKMDQETLIDVVLAANYMDVRDLLVETTKAVADQFKGKSPEEIREQFGIVNDYSPEDEARARQEVSWAFDHFVPDSCKKAGGNASGK
uniref:SKP1-like protein n=1 Tax=Kalanchoe fedtschenkoi TaxID=63787 RepID=A0A7N0TC28_KALFE